MEDWMKPMLCIQGGSENGYLNNRYVAEGKLDGWRVIVHKDVLGDIRLYSGRNAANYTGQLPYLEEALDGLLPPDTAVDGELISPAGHSAVGSCMRTNHPHRPSTALPAMYVVVFDVLRVAGEDVRSWQWASRRRLVEQVTQHPGVLMHSMILPNRMALEVALNAGLEGVVFKDRQSPYINGRSRHWVKIKPQTTCDARVIGFKPGEGSFSGMIGAIEFELLDSGVKSRCSGFDMRLRQEITDHMGEWLGRIIEIKHHGITRDGKPRHPQYLRTRDDLAV